MIWEGKNPARSAIQTRNKMHGRCFRRSPLCKILFDLFILKLLQHFETLKNSSLGRMEQVCNLLLKYYLNFITYFESCNEIVLNAVYMHSKRACCHPARVSLLLAWFLATCGSIFALRDVVSHLSTRSIYISIYIYMNRAVHLQVGTMRAELYIEM